MDEVEAYRERIERRYGDRRKKSRRGKRDRRYKPPRFWTVGFVVQLVGMILMALTMMLLSGCQAIKKTLIGG